MIQRLLQGLLLSSFLCFGGCAALNDFEDALEGAGWAQFDRAGRRANQRGRVALIAHRADGSWTLGAGAVVRGGRVLTVAHVLNGATEIEAEVQGRMISVVARVERRIRAVPEDLIELRLEESPGMLGFEGFEAEDTLEVAAGEPSQLWACSTCPALRRPATAARPSSIPRVAWSGSSWVTWAVRRSGARSRLGSARLRPPTSASRRGPWPLTGPIRASTAKAARRAPAPQSPRPGAPRGSVAAPRGSLGG